MYYRPPPEDGVSASEVQPYVESVLRPFEAPLARVPTELAFPSCLLRDRETFQLTIGATGDFVGYWSPTFPCRYQSPASTGVWQYYFAARSGTGVSYAQTAGAIFADATSANWADRQKSATAGNGPYASYMAAVRVVSAGLRIKYIGRLDAHSGAIVSGFTAVTQPIPSLVTFPVASAIYELLGAAKTSPIDGLELKYIPLDESAREFTGVSDATTGFNSRDHAFETYFLYGYGLPAGTVLDFEMVTNYEFLPAIQYTELLSGSQQSPAYKDPDGTWAKAQGLLSRGFNTLLTNVALPAAEAVAKTLIKSISSF